MAVSKITTPPTQKEAIDKINEIIDNMGGTIVVDQTYDGTSVNPQSGVAIAGAKFIQNTANISFALGIGGINSPATASGMSSIAIGGGALANTLNTMAIGRGAEARSQGAIQLGYGANYSKSLSVGFYDSNTPANYKLLDGTTGLIPYQRIDSLTDSNAGGQLKYWTGTKAEYDAIANKDANTLYNITDDTDTTALQQLMATKANLNLANCTVPYVVSRTPNNYNGVVEIWSDGYYVETGEKAANVTAYTLSHTITSCTNLGTSTRNNYNITLNAYLSGTTLTVIGLTASGSQYNNWTGYWRAEGYIQ